MLFLSLKYVKNKRNILVIEILPRGGNIMESAISGYLGLFKQPIDSRYVSTIYGITDNTKGTLILVLLSPESFIDAYKISKLITYNQIYYIVPSLDVLFISDIFNLYMKIKNIKPNAKWVFPLNPPMSTSVEFENAQIKTDSLSVSIAPLYNESLYYNQSNFYNYETSLLINFVRSNIDDARNYYDIIIRDSIKTMYFSQYITQTKMEVLYNDITIDEVHLPYNSTLYGGLNYNQLVTLNNKYHNKLKVHSFLSVEEYLFCKQTILSRLGEVKYNDFI